MLRRDFFKGLAVAAVATPLLLTNINPQRDWVGADVGGEKFLFVGDNRYQKMKAQALNMHLMEMNEVFMHGVKMTRFKHPFGFEVNVIKHPILTKAGA
ncbi:hypothetical protein LCGC14_2696800 [marine sediment metagenome]|uniref:Uncharacterized protein n=1 Tax=marine sediment metagenome TaxID=412755 RepID=A0A0F8ZH26_9ZZZZ